MLSRTTKNPDCLGVEIPLDACPACRQRGLELYEEAMDGTLNDLEARYAAEFLRIHRNALVARRAIRTLEKHFDPEELEGGESWAVRLHGLGELLAVSRRQVAAVREEMAR